MNKAELINAIAEKAELTKVQAKGALDATLEAIAEALAKDDKVALIGFGTFAVVEKGERTGINPATKEKITIPARKAIKFKASASKTNFVAFCTDNDSSNNRNASLERPKPGPQTKTSKATCINKSAERNINSG